MTKKAIVVRTCIEGIPRILVVHSVSNPLGHNFLFTFKDGASRVFGKSSVHNLAVGINVGKENGIAHLGFDVDSRIAEIGVAAFARNFAVIVLYHMWMESGAGGLLGNRNTIHYANQRNWKE